MNSDRKGLIKSVSKAINILSLFDKNRELGVSDVSRILGYHKSTTFGLIMTLQEHGFIEQNKETGKYKLGFELFRLGSKVEYDLRAIVRPYLEKLVKQFQETVHLVVHDDCNVLYLDKFESPHSMRICSKVGEKVPVYCTAVGKAILANLNPDESTDIIQRLKFEKLTDNTIADSAQLLGQLKEIQEKGYAEDKEELELGLWCVATPIFNYTGRPIAAISVSGPLPRMTEEIRDEIVISLKTHTKEASEKLGYVCAL